MRPASTRVVEGAPAGAEALAAVEVSLPVPEVAGAEVLAAVAVHR